MMTKPHDHLRDSGSEDAPPPTGGSWTFLYAIVLAALAALVVAFYVFTRAFR
jgi:hypothetical protein